MVKEIDKLCLMQSCHPSASSFNEIPVIDLSSPDAKDLIVKACENYGFFKLINHGMSMENVMILENEAISFFNLPQLEKDKASSFGYGNKKIGNNGDMGWVEYLLFSCASINDHHLQASSLISKENQEIFRTELDEYISSSKEVCCHVLNTIAEGLKIDPTNSISEFIKEKGSDTIFRINHYPPSSELINGKNVVGFGEHTDPQIISLLRSNNITGLEICLKNGDWVSINPDPNSLFVAVGDCLEVMSNGRFKSVKHRVTANSESSRISMIYFAGPSMGKTIEPLASLLASERSLYKHFIWSDYKKSAFSLRLNENRLLSFKII
ncbi:gibberellin 2-beta-dioxygenase 1-like [Impatiens glandulifera]|uniref:gibberellin 2-beta-dioxygenase 1-like n=1 Tax=Impatiens glandulifera TaxID=253017 RepID=UPI001FB13AD9|nr:gibberellin 2-beta-dioxygenase 1-like [Impatiens glandulifera]